MCDLLTTAINYYCQFKNWRMRRFFLRNASKYHYARQEHGITVIGTLETRGSLSKVLRDFVRALKNAGIPYQTFSTSVRRGVPDEDVCDILTPLEEFRAHRFPLVLEMFDSVFPVHEIGVKLATVAFWEFESGLFEAHPHLRQKESLVGMSDFNANYFKSVVGSKQHAAKLLYPFRMPRMNLPPILETRSKFGIGNDDFVVLFNFDYGSSVGRKNPDGAIRAFATAFGDVPRAKLVFKTQGAATHGEAVQKLRNLTCELGIERQFISIDHYISETDVYALTNACDVYLSLHRGEGFGLGIAEAMSLGKAAVVTNYSSTTEFCNEQTAMLVDYQLTPLTEEQRQEHPFLKSVVEWAEPDIDCAAKALRELYDNPAKRKKLGENAKDFIADHFSIDNFRSSVNDLLGHGGLQ